MIHVLEMYLTTRHPDELLFLHELVDSVRNPGKES